MPDRVLKDVLFLLGGYDLEMCTIREVLAACHCAYADHHLQWDNARLSHYREEIGQFRAKYPEGFVYGIELQNDLDVPMSFYHAIDHHNYLFQLPSALEQLLQLLQIPLNRTYRLIAANDRAYIPGMLAEGATPEEIASIRLADRRAQGVTEEEERLAARAVDENLEKCGNLLVIRAYSSRFSPLCDRLYPYRSLLVYTEKEWAFYGIGVEQVREMLKNDYEEGKTYFGGGPNGYVGAKQGAYTESEIKEIVNRIKDEYV